MPGYLRKLRGAASLVGLPLKLRSTGSLGSAVGYNLALFNAVDVIASLLVIFMAVALLVHRLFWPFVDRPLYALATQTASRRKLLIAAGLALIAFAMGGLSDAFKKILKILESLS